MKHQQTNTHWPYDLSSAPHPAGYKELQTFDRLAGLELKMEQLIRAIEVNNELLRTLQEQQSRVCANGGVSDCPDVEAGACPHASITLKKLFSERRRVICMWLHGLCHA